MMFYYAYVSTEFDVSIWLPYDYCNDILRYYNIADELHASEAIQAHYTLIVF